MWRMHLPPQSEWTNARAHTALCAAFSSSERVRRSCATTIVVVPATHTVALNKDTGLSGRGLQAHRSRSQGATTSHSAIFARIFNRGIALGRSGVTGMACLPSLIGMRGRCAVVEEQDCWLLVVTHGVRGWTCSPDPASCRCRTLAQATRQEDL